MRRTAVCVVVALILTSCGPKIERRELSKEDSQRFIESTIESAYVVGPDRAGVIVKARLQCDQNSESNPSHCILQAGDMMSIPDHHVVTFITLKEITPESLVFEYKAEFNHSSFGKNLITKTTGILYIPIRAAIPPG